MFINSSLNIVGYVSVNASQRTSFIFFSFQILKYKDFFILYTTGRKTGKMCKTPLIYFEDNSNYFIVVSNTSSIFGMTRFVGIQTFS